VTVDYAKLPGRTLKAGAQLYRIHRALHGAWFFDGSGNGRFDPAGTPGRGACYWAEEPLGAWVEVFRTRMLLTASDLATRRLSVASLGRDVMVRDLASRRALKAGITGALTGGGDYTDAHALADALQSSAPALRWRLRHDLGGKLIGVAWFGEEGPASRRGLADLPATTTEKIPDDLVTKASRTFGYEVLPDPPA
jgi:hypothetical protein